MTNRFDAKYHTAGQLKPFGSTATGIDKFFNVQAIDAQRWLIGRQPHRSGRTQLQQG